MSTNTITPTEMASIDQVGGDEKGTMEEAPATSAEGKEPEAPAGALLRELLLAEAEAMRAFLAALRDQRAVLASRQPHAIVRAGDLVGVHIQHLAYASSRRIRRALGLGLTTTDTSIGELARLLRTVDPETAALCTTVRDHAAAAVHEATINRRIAMGQLGVSQGALEAIREAVTPMPLGYDPHEPSGPIPGSIITRHV